MSRTSSSPRVAITRARSIAVAAAILVAMLLPGCRGLGTAKPAADLLAGGYPIYRDKGNGITAILATPDLGVGTFRFAIALSDSSGLIRDPAVMMQSYPPGATGSLQATAQEVAADFRAFPDGSRGLYSTSFTFDRAGKWSVVVAVPRPGGSTVLMVLPVTVAQRSSAPAVHEAALASKNRIAADVPSLDRLTTGSAPDSALYQHRIADSIAAHRPTVVIFASPAFCTTPLCGPQVEDASVLAKTYGDRADFIHVDLYQNPQEIKGDLSRAVRSPLLKEWGLQTDEWTFVIDANGKIAARFEAYAPPAEVEAALSRVLPRSPR